MSMMSGKVIAAQEGRRSLVENTFIEELDERNRVAGVKEREKERKEREEEPFKEVTEVLNRRFVNVTITLEDVKKMKPKEFEKLFRCVQKNKKRCLFSFLASIPFMCLGLFFSIFPPNITLSVVSISLFSLSALSLVLAAYFLDKSKGR